MKVLSVVGARPQFVKLAPVAAAFDAVGVDHVVVHTGQHNRVLTDHSADLCLAPTQVAVDHLAREGLSDRTVLVGDVMTDVLKKVAAAVALSPVDSPVPVDGPDFVLATIHRPDNTDDPSRLRAILDGLAGLDRTVYLAAHPRLVSYADRHGLALKTGAIVTVPPLAYPRLVQALATASHVVTDSGGLQKEAFLMGVPATTIRPETEWVETLVDGWNVLTPDPCDIAAAVARPRPAAERAQPYGGGDAAARTAQTLIDRSVS